MADASSRPPGGPVLLDPRSLPDDPDPQFLKEVLRGNVSFVTQQARPRVPPNMEAYLSWEEALGTRLPPQGFIEAFAACSWRGTLVRASLLAAILANRSAEHGGPDAEKIIRAPLNRHRRDLNPVWARISEYVAENPERPLAHEQVIYLIAAMAVLYGRDEGPEASPEHFALMFLAGNDYLSAWSEQDSRQLTVEDGLAAQLAHVARFNTYPDPLRDLVRVNLVYSRRPPQGPLSDERAWAETQKRAFGSAFEEFFSTFIMPLQFETQRWGTEDGENLVAPVIAPSRWYANTSVDPAAGKAFLDALTTTREEAQAEFRARAADGIPHAPTLFIRKPFVRIDDLQVLGVSPWTVREQLKGGVYTAFSRVVNAEYDKEVWPSAFGHLFELHCRDVAVLARNSGAFRGDLVLSDAPGSPDEIEDVVIVESAGCILGSAKSKLVREDVARQARSRTALLDWYDEFFFAKSKGRYQPGALRLLDRRIGEIREGKHKQIPANTLIAPLLITFDDIADNPMLARWIARRCREEGLLAQPNVLPAILSPVDEFEVLVGFAAKGRSVIELLTSFTRDREGHSNLNNFLHRVRKGDNVRLPELEARFHAITEETKRRLFPKSSPPG
jgi:hypothetical protein